MSEAEAHLRFKEARKRSLQIQEILREFHKSDADSASNKKKDFISPCNAQITESRWKEFSINAAKQLYGIQQKVK